jgi:hypothetical protein
MWSYRSQKEWIELAGLKERTGKAMFKMLVEQGFILKDTRLGGPPGNRKIMMHVALTDKTYAILDEAGVPSMALPVTNAEFASAVVVHSSSVATGWAELALHRAINCT